MSKLYDKIQETTTFIKGKTSVVPQVGVILGSGIGCILDILTIEAEIEYSEIPNFPVTTVKGHDGKLVFGKLGGKPVVIMAGRFHYYEGYNMEEVTFPVRIMRALGAETLIVSNAAGGMNSKFRIGDLMFIKDHINLFPEHPLRGANDDRLGIRFPDMSEPYSLDMIRMAEEIAQEQNITAHTGVYVGLSGPTFETPAEYHWLRVIGGEAVGMSTVPEVIVAIHGGMKVFAASIITDLGVEGHVEKITHEEVLAAANAAAPRLAGLIAKLIERI